MSNTVKAVREELIEGAGGVLCAAATGTDRMRSGEGAAATARHHAAKDVCPRNGLRCFGDHTKRATHQLNPPSLPLEVPTPHRGMGTADITPTNWPHVRAARPKRRQRMALVRRGTCLARLSGGAATHTTPAATPQHM